MPENVSYDQAPKYLAEFIGTFFLVFTVGNNVLGDLTIWGVTSIACSLMVGIYALGAASGAHFNPAVTTAVYLTGKLPGGLKEAGFYVAAQCTGALVAAFSYLMIHGKSFNLMPQTTNSIEHTPWQAFTVETLYTCMLCFVVLNVACTASSQGNQYFGLAIGFVIVAGGYAAGGISGGAFNPALALAVDLSSAARGFKYCFLYIAAELVGAAIAVALFKLIRPEEFGNAAGKNSLRARLLSEAVGAFFLTLTVGLNVVMGVRAGAYSIGAALMCMVYALGNCSGAHFNPAVTAAILFSGRGKIDSSEAFMYMGSQVVGALAAAFTFVGIKGNAVAVGPGGGFSWYQLGMAEVLYTCLLCLVVLSVATVSKPSKDLFGLSIGSVITVAGFAGKDIGVSLNPAVSIALDATNAVKGTPNGAGASLIYTGLEIAGAGLAALAFQTLYPEEYKGERYAK